MLIEKLRATRDKFEEPVLITVFCTFAEQVMSLQVPVNPYRERRPCNDGACKNRRCPAYDNTRHGVSVALTSEKRFV